MFLVYSSNRREWKERNKRNIFIGSIYQKLIGKSIIIEQPILKEQDTYSLLHYRNIIFFDWAILLSIFKNFLKLKQIPEIAKWVDLENKCKKINFEIVLSDWMIDTIKELIILMDSKVIIQVEAAEIVIKNLDQK